MRETDDPIRYADPLGDEADDDPGFLSVAGNFLKGVGQSVVSTVKGVGNAVLHPIETAKGIGNAIAHPIETGKAIVGAVKETYQEFQAGNADVKANILGKLVGEVGQIAIGAGAVKAGTTAVKGVSVAEDVSKVAKISRSPITGHTKHGLNQSIGRDGGRGVNAAAKLDAVRNPTKVVTQDGGRTKFVGKNAQVVLNSEGKVITVTGKSRGPVQRIIGQGNAAQRRANSLGLEYDPKKIK